MSSGTLISNGLFLAVFVGISFVMDSFFILYAALAIIAVAALFRLIRGQPLVPLAAIGTDYSDEYRIEGDMVTVEREGEVLTAPLASFSAVRWCEKTVQRGALSAHRRRRQDVFQILELVHETDSNRNVNLYTSQEVTGMRGRWQEAAKTCNLPAIRDLGDGRTVRREPEDLGKPLRDLVLQGVVKTNFNPDASPPPGTHWTLDDDVLYTHLRQAGAPIVVIAAPILLSAVIVGVMVPANPINTVLALSILVGVLSLWLLISFWVRVTPERLTVGWGIGPLPLWRRSIELAKIEDVLIGTGLLSWASVIIEGETTMLRLGPLSDENAIWLSDFLIAAVATVPDTASRDR
ncbi:hypothetical protein [Aliiroseovarius sp. PrR006]|uniref:hypothetical protein n=1 Tax=Aliiroseovarius sp. PrR006 TaxID=2706883 RepID=UPI0013CF731C|nr:hypothetical protein [Aliiroseovarius sp. PrR006]NDW53892.1 hypothetical protein [Aliiroseovarius sp. PrR006]